jgi:two-component system, cell cycle sensor histidine kinase and response regulator CckA
MPSPLSPPSGLQVLLVEDSPNDAELIEDHLRRGEVVAASVTRVTTRDDFLRELRAPPDVILCDYQLGGFTGLDALKLMRECRLDIPFILVSGTIGEEIAVEAIRSGASDYLLKDRLGRLGTAISRAVADKKLRTAARSTEEDLRQSEEKYRSLFEHVPDAAYLCDTITGRIIDTNRSGEAMLGRDRSALLGLRLSRLISTDDWRALLALGEDPSPAPAAQEIQVTNCEGHGISVQARATTLLLYGRRLLLAFLRETSAP